MSWTPRLVAMAWTVAAFGSLVTAAGTASLPIGKNGDVEFTETVTVGPTVLQPGHYRFKHTVQDGEHYLLIGRQQMARVGPGGAGTNEHYGIGKGTEVARIPCTVVPLDRKVKHTEVHIRTEPDGSRTVTQIRIEGEGLGHMLALEPQR